LVFVLQLKAINSSLAIHTFRPCYHLEHKLVKLLNNMENVNVILIAADMPLFMIASSHETHSVKVSAYRRILKPQKVSIIKCGVLPHNSCMALLQMGSAEFNHCPYLRIQESDYLSIFQCTFSFQLSSTLWKR